MGKEAVDSLLDVSAGLEIEKKIKSVAAESDIEVKSLKTQKKGAVITANLAIVLPPAISVGEAEKISDRLRQKLTQTIQNLAYVAIEIRSHELTTGFYQPEFGRGFGWNKRGRFQKDDNGQGRGPGGNCVCPNCGWRVAHQGGTPCAAIKCQKCQIGLERD
jgi:hypothetical protein